MTGMLFDIKEFAVNDGPGIRITVFLKGCPMRCKWCHNPEGLTKEPQKNLKTGLMVGEEWTDVALVEYLAQFKKAFDLSGGGVTFSGGEATMQPEFLMSCADKLHEKGIEVNLDTSGYCDSGLFCEILQHLDWCYFDLKCMDSDLHRKMTGVGNELIHENLLALSKSQVLFHVRVPLVPGVGDTVENRRATERLVEQLPRKPLKIDWLPFNTLAPGKYPIYGMKYEFDSQGAA